MVITRRTLVGRAANAGALLTAHPLLAATNAPAPTRIAFGSCARQNRPQPIWRSVLARKPELFLFLGDNIYADTNDMKVLRAEYARLAAQPGFAKLRKACPILATWDDHDYGRNNAGAEFKQKDASQREFVRFFDPPADAGPRHRPGVYDAHFFGPQGRCVQVIMLDTRYFRDALVDASPNDQQFRPPFQSSPPSSTLLGRAQWTWLARQLRAPADVRIIASSIQFVSDQHHRETWGNFPHERRRLIELITNAAATGVVFLSGDRHMAELSILKAGVDGAPYPLHDLTSSGLNQTGGRPGEPNPYQAQPMYQGPNFGSVDIDFDTDEPTLSLRAHDVNGTDVIAHTVPLRDLRPRP